MLENYLKIFIPLLIIVCIIGIFIGRGRITMIQKSTGYTKKVKSGFSFTYLFFGSFVPLIRGHIGGFFLTLFLEVFSLGLFRVVLVFKYNRMYIDYLVRSGYTIYDLVEEDSTLSKFLDKSNNKNDINDPNNKNIYSLKNSNNDNIIDNEYIEKLIDELNKNYECYNMGIYNINEFAKRKKELLESVYKIDIKESKIDFISRFSNLFSKKIINKDDIEIVKNTVDKIFTFKKLSDEKLLELLITANEENINIIKYELKHRERSLDLINKVLYYNEFSSQDLLNSMNLRKGKKIFGDNNSIDVQAIKILLFIRGIDVDSISKKKREEENLKKRQDTYNTLKKYKEKLAGKLICFSNEIKNILRKVVNKSVEFILKCIKSKKIWIIFISFILVSIIVINIYNFILFLPLKNDVIKDQFSNNLIRYCDNLVGYNIDKIDINSKNKKGDTYIYYINSKLISSTDEFVGDFKVVYKKGKTSWELSNISIDKNSIHITPVNGVNYDILKKSLTEYIKDNLIDYVKYNKINNINIINQNDDLSNGKSSILASAELDSYFYKLIAEINFEYEFEEKWNIKGVNINKETIKLEEKQGDLNLGQVTDTIVKDDLINKGINVNGKEYMIRESEIDSIKLKSTDINKKDNRMKAIVNLKILNNELYIEGDLPLTYIIDESENPKWINFSENYEFIENENLKIIKTVDYAKNMLTEDLIKNKILGYTMLIDSDKCTIREYDLNGFKIESISDIKEDLSVKIKHIIYRPIRDAKVDEVYFRIPSEITVETGMKFYNGEWNIDYINYMQ